jgi:hypothetical protein
MTLDWCTRNAGKSVSFYFVGNDATSGGPHAALTANRNSIDAFTGSLTNALTLTDGKLALIDRPNGTDRNMLFSDATEAMKVIGTVTYNSELRRRVARFDIRNAAVRHAEHSVAVTRVFVDKAAPAGLIFGTADPQTLTALQHTSHREIPGPALADYTLDAPEAAAGAKDMAPGVFYLYPTHLGSNEADTEIRIGVSIDGNPERFYSLELPSGGADVRANNRYIITIDPDLSGVKVDGGTDDYGNGDEFGAGR